MVCYDSEACAILGVQSLTPSQRKLAGKEVDSSCTTLQTDRPTTPAIDEDEQYTNSVEWKYQPEIRPEIFFR